MIFGKAVYYFYGFNSVWPYFGHALLNPYYLCVLD